MSFSINKPPLTPPPLSYSPKTTATTAFSLPESFNLNFDRPSNYTHKNYNRTTPTTQYVSTYPFPSTRDKEYPPLQ